MMAAPLVFIRHKFLKSQDFCRRKRDFHQQKEGTALHFVMQKLNLDKIYTTQQIQEQINYLVERPF